MGAGDTGTGWAGWASAHPGNNFGGIAHSKFPSLEIV